MLTRIKIWSQESEEKSRRWKGQVRVPPFSPTGFSSSMWLIVSQCVGSVNEFTTEKVTQEHTTVMPCSRVGTASGDGYSSSSGE